MIPYKEEIGKLIFIFDDDRSACVLHKTLWLRTFGGKGRYQTLVDVQPVQTFSYDGDIVRPSDISNIL